MMEARSGLFNPKIPPEFNQDEAVLFHEVGHAVTWCACGGNVEKITWMRVDGLLGGVTRCGFNGRRVVENEHNTCLLAERLLAGESAARRLLGTMSREQICSFGVSPNPKRSVSYPLMALHLIQKKRRYGARDLDVVAALDLAKRWNRGGWHDWITERLENARTRVDENWAAIEGLAAWMRPKLPAVGILEPVVIEGIEEELKRLNVRRGPTVIEYGP